MQKPNVFIGSSSEGRPIAEAVFTHLSDDAMPKIWTHQIFLPGRYPLEALEGELRTSNFAVLVASPDDELVKRGVAAPAMRDNILLEFGLFSGVLGRKRTFFLCPSDPQISLPSDLLGIIYATYDAERVAGGVAERAAAVQNACLGIKEVIREEWAAILHSKEERLLRLQNSQGRQAIKRLYAVASRFRDTLVAVQRDTVAVISDRPGFEQVKSRAADELARIAESCTEDARLAGAEEELKALQAATNEALLDLPFPEELSVGRESSRQRAVDVGIQAIGSFLGGGDPVRHVQDEVETEIRSRMAGLRRRYSEWWDKHATPLQSAANQMQDKLFAALERVASEEN
jgi:predicted nucleotide-binding protein with TIR-like domain